MAADPGEDGCTGVEGAALAGALPGVGEAGGELVVLDGDAGARFLPREELRPKEVVREIQEPKEVRCRLGGTMAPAAG